jgi:hypothetical protein
MKKLEERNYLLILMFGILLTVLSPIIFTLPSISQRFNFSSTGSIGDTIGGLTAPIVGLLGAILVYRSFLIQIKANEEIRKENFLKLLDDYIYKLAGDKPNIVINAMPEKYERWFNYVEKQPNIDQREKEEKIRDTKNNLIRFDFLLTKTNYLFDKIYSDKVNEIERGFILLFKINELINQHYQIVTLRKIKAFYPKILDHSQNEDKEISQLLRKLEKRLEIFINYYDKITNDCITK